MARGDVTIFEEARADLIEGRYASNANIYCGIVTNDVTPTASYTTPHYSTFFDVHFRNSDNFGFVSFCLGGN